MDLIPLFTNNSRKMHGIPLRRKADKHKRFYTRCQSWEDFCAWYECINDTNHHGGYLRQSI